MLGIRLIPELWYKEVIKRIFDFPKWDNVLSMTAPLDLVFDTPDVFSSLMMYAASLGRPEQTHDCHRIAFLRAGLIQGHPPCVTVLLSKLLSTTGSFLFLP